jgi:uncharacterized protein
MLNALPVTTVLKIEYKDGMHDACLQWMKETASVASRFKGFVGKDIYASAEEENELVNIFTFTDWDSIQVWENSVERMMQTKKGERFIEEIKTKSQLTGLEFMFSASHPPKKWKMVAATVCVIFILLNTLVPMLQKVFSLLNFPVLVKSFLGVFVMVSLMTLVIMPLLTKLFGKWLSK